MSSYSESYWKKYPAYFLFLLFPHSVFSSQRKWVRKLLICHSVCVFSSLVFLHRPLKDFASTHLQAPLWQRESLFFYITFLNYFITQAINTNFYTFYSTPSCARPSKREFILVQLPFLQLFKHRNWYRNEKNQRVSQTVLLRPGKSEWPSNFTGGFAWVWASRLLHRLFFCI